MPNEAKSLQIGDLLAIDEAAVLIRVKPCTIRLWLSKGRLTRVKAGKRTLVRRSDLESLVGMRPPALGPSSAATDTNELPAQAA